MMRLRKECEHDRYDPHTVVNDARGDLYDVARCPGGEFLPEGALVIEEQEGKYIIRPYPWPKWASPIVALLDALASRVGESER